MAQKAPPRSKALTASELRNLGLILGAGVDRFDSHPIEPDATDVRAAIMVRQAPIVVIGF